MAASATTALSSSVRDEREVGVGRSEPGAGEDFAFVLGRFACELSLGDLTAPVIAAVKANVFDTLACATAGSSAPAVAETRELAVEWAGAPQATILVFGEKVPAHHAAWVNGTMAHARDYDDTHDAAVLHAGVSVIPAALAAAELRHGARGSDFIAGVAAGLETICRLGVATQIGIIESGYMYTSLFGHFAATVAAGRVLGLDAGADGQCDRHRLFTGRGQSPGDARWRADQADATGIRRAGGARFGAARTARRSRRASDVRRSRRIPARLPSRPL